MTKAVAALALVLNTLASHGAAQVVTPLELVRCAAGTDIPCVRARVSLSPAVRRVASHLDPSHEVAAWTGELADHPLVGPGIVLATSAVLPTRLLILVDRGSAMAGEGIAFARSALTAWLTTLDTLAIRVAVVGFDGRDLAQELESVTFVPPRAAAAVVAGLPAPAPNARAPLFSALWLASQRLAEARAADSTGNLTLVVISPGRNDIGRGKETSGLLVGDSGLRAAAARIEASGQRSWIMALGVTAIGEDLRVLAGANGSVEAVPLDPNALESRLVAVSREFVGERQFTFGVGAYGLADLGRTAVPGAIVLRSGGVVSVRSPLAWRPPLIALPAFRGVADSAALSPSLREALNVGNPPASNRPVIAFLMAILVGSAWMLLARPGPVDPQVAPRARDRMSSTTRSGIASSAVQEGLPRKPEDITHQTARRTAMHR